MRNKGISPLTLGDGVMGFVEGCEFILMLFPASRAISSARWCFISRLAFCTISSAQVGELLYFCFCFCCCVHSPAWVVVLFCFCYYCFIFFLLPWWCLISAPCAISAARSGGAWLSATVAILAQRVVKLVLLHFLLLPPIGHKFIDFSAIKQIFCEIEEKESGESFAKINGLFFSSCFLAALRKIGDKYYFFPGLRKRFKKKKMNFIASFANKTKKVGCILLFLLKKSSVRKFLFSTIVTWN